MLEDLLLLLQVLQLLKLLLDSHFGCLSVPDLLLEHELVGHLLLILLLSHGHRHHRVVVPACSDVLACRSLVRQR